MSNTANNTKIKILETSICLFDKKGYENVTIREIAAEVGIKGSSIYNHFSGKQNILEEILEYHKNALSQIYNDEKSTLKFNEILGKRDLKKILVELLYMAINGLNNPMLQKVLKILSVEQLKVSIVREYFYNDYLIKARSVFKHIFDVLNDTGVIDYEDTDFLANEFHAFIIYKFYEHFMLLQDYEFNNKEMISTFMKHIDFFVASIGSKQGV